MPPKGWKKSKSAPVADAPTELEAAVVEAAEAAPAAEVKTKPQAKSFEDKMADALERAFEKAIPAAMAASDAIRGKQAKDNEDEKIRAANKNIVRCVECRQPVTSCKGKHRQTVLYPTGLPPSMAKTFQGVWLNGQHYLSRSPQDRITVPEDSCMERDMQVWEKGRWDLINGKEVNVKAGVAGNGGIQAFPIAVGNGYVS